MKLPLFCLMVGMAFAAGAGNIQGLYQAIYSGQNVTTGDPAVDGVRIPEGAILSATPAGNPSISATSGGVTYTVGGNTTVAYKGLMKLTAGKTYVFVKNFDDSGSVKITTPGGTTTTVLNSTSYNEVKYGSYAPEVTGWYTIELRLGNGGGGVGPQTAPFTSEPCASLLWNDEGLTSCTTENRSSWHRFVNTDPEGVYLYTAIPSREIAAVYQLEGDVLSAELTVEDGEACDYYVCYGQRDAGETTNNWDHVVRVGTIPAGATSLTDSSVSGIGTSVNYVRYATYSADSNTFGFTGAYSVPSRALIPEDCASTVVFTATKVDAGTTVSDCPVLVRLSDYVPGFRYAKLFRQDHADMLFLDASGNILPYEVEEWLPDGESLVWVRVPTVTKDTQITLKYGSVNAAENDPTAVWTGGAEKTDFGRTLFLAAEEPGGQEPILQEASVAVERNVLKMQVFLYRAGLGGSGSTTVAIDLGSSPDTLATVYTFDPVVTSGILLAHDLELGYGQTYYFRFRAWSEADGEKYESITPTLSAETLDTMVWNGNGMDWHTVANWDGGSVPDSLLKAHFNSAGGRVEAAADGAASELGFATDTPVTMAFGEHVLTAAKIDVGKEKKTLLTLESGTFDLGAITYVKKTEDHLLRVEKDATLKLSGAVNIPTCRNRWVIDGGRLETDGTFSLSSRSGSNGNNTEGSSVTLLNGATWQTAATIKCGCWHNARIEVLSGSTLTSGSINISNDGDSGSGNGMVVSNATASVSSLTVCSDDRHGNSFFRLYQDAGESASMTVSGDMGVASQGNGCRNGRNIKVDIAGGTLTVGGSLRVSSDEKEGATQTNRVTISRSTARVAVTKGCKFQRDTEIRFVVPEEGFAAADGVITAGTTMAFSALSKVTVDATAVRQPRCVKLLAAETSLSGLTADRVTVQAHRTIRPIVKIDEKSLTVDFKGTGLKVILR